MQISVFNSFVTKGIIILSTLISNLDISLGNKKVVMLHKLNSPHAIIAIKLDRIT